MRIVHIGLGAFHRSHQAWYTERADPNNAWGIAAFTGRSPEAADILAAQDGLYTLVERGDDGDEFGIMCRISAAYDGGDLAQLTKVLSAPETSLLTITITEPAYHLGMDGLLNPQSAAVASDTAALKDMWASSGSLEVEGDYPQLTTMGARVLPGLDARRRRNAGPIAVVSCDNLTSNGSAACQAIQGLASLVSAELCEWIQANVSFVDTSVDRITPRTTEADATAVREATGFDDAAPVITEPFSSWILSGEFPAGRPAWENAGALFVNDIVPFEQRKLWLLNGAHSLLAYAGQLRGLRTVSDAVADPSCAAELEAFWDEAAAHLDHPELNTQAYRAALLNRFRNTRIEHLLEQIGIDGTTKLRMRAVPVLIAERSAGRTGEGSARIIAAWAAFLLHRQENGARPVDAEAQRLSDILKLSGRDLTKALVTTLNADLGADTNVVDLVHRLRGSW
ncbi:mannitol dehydrogenase family protein [Arthrobacter sp. Alg241-R88]|uniref:mannitol dehydrogenase family protein n=1 Tax=Arthrobacter sp. Alg241-R88 TaxID=2305984 RepID=UPI001F087967|nr:mannitol dehydrogenase family protein [Arthrobacter sp. Alg241-R88]